MFLYLTAAFDIVWHTGLLLKISKVLPWWFTRAIEVLSNIPPPHLRREEATAKLLKKVIGNDSLPLRADIMFHPDGLYGGASQQRT